MKRALALSLALFAGLSPAIAWAADPARPDVIDIRKGNALDCTFRLTNDHVDSVIMMQDTTLSADACRAACARFAEESIVSMRDAVEVLRYTCHYRETMVADIDLKQG